MRKELSIAISHLFQRVSQMNFQTILSPSLSSLMRLRSARRLAVNFLPLWPSISIAASTESLFHYAFTFSLEAPSVSPPNWEKCQNRHWRRRSSQCTRESGNHHNSLQCIGRTRAYDGRWHSIDNCGTIQSTRYRSFSHRTTTFSEPEGCLQRKGQSLPIWQTCVRSLCVCLPAHSLA